MYHLLINVLLSSTSLAAVTYLSPDLFGILGSFFPCVEFVVLFESLILVVTFFDIVE